LQNRGAQLLRLQTGIVATWGIDIVMHYSWYKLLLDSAKKPHSDALSLETGKRVITRGIAMETILVYSSIVTLGDRTS
jgi:hypothetical protein